MLAHLRVLRQDKFLLLLRLFLHHSTERAWCPQVPQVVVNNVTPSRLRMLCRRHKVNNLCPLKRVGGRVAWICGPNEVLLVLVYHFLPFLLIDMCHPKSCPITNIHFISLTICTTIVPALCSNVAYHSKQRANYTFFLSSTFTMRRDALRTFARLV